ncbi:MAG: class I SAM-dependent methyltransferase [Phycisphaerales bacterium]|nr:class I SAM-dependent methyltransferase [Phycisphaerales bacterium]
MKPLEHRYRDKRKRKPFEPKPITGDATSPPPHATKSATASGAKSAADPSSKSAAPTTHWGEVASWYDHLVGDAGSEYHQKVVLPGVLRMLTPGPADISLDIACGQGVLCRKLREKGAKVIGVDAAGELIRLAQARGDEGIDYQVMDARDLSRLPENRFTTVSCLLAIQNIDPMPPVFEGITRVMRGRGRFVLVMMHPCFRVPRQAHWAGTKNSNYNSAGWTSTCFLSNSPSSCTRARRHNPGRCVNKSGRFIDLCITTSVLWAKPG